MSLVFTLTDSSTAVTLTPEYDYTDAGAKIEERHRVRDGGQFRYKFGAYDAFEFGVRYVNSSDMSTLNNWWTSNSSLYFLVNSDVYAVMISNDAKPINKFVPPYDTLYEGTLRLETY